MREIKFRGKAYDKELGFVYGDVTHNEDTIEMIADGQYIQVDPETIGQYTGLRDKNGREIYEGDIIEVSSDVNYHAMPPDGMFEVEFYEGGFWAKPRSKERAYAVIALHKVAEYAVIRGNIHEPQGEQ